MPVWLRLLPQDRPFRWRTDRLLRPGLAMISTLWFTWRDSIAAPANALICRRQGLPDCHGAGTSVRGCMPHRVRHRDGEADRRSRRSGRAAGTRARTIGMPPVSSRWIPVRRQASAPGASSGPDHGWRSCPGTPRRSRPPPSPPGRRKMRLIGASAYLSRHHAERPGQPGRTRADPPIGAAV